LDKLSVSIQSIYLTDNRLLDSSTYGFPLPPILEKLYAHKIRVRNTPLVNVNFTSGDNVQILVFGTKINFDVDFQGYCQ
jgi:hypothetical protein